MKKTILTILLLTSLHVYAPELSIADKESKELNKENNRRLDYLMSAEFSEDNLRELLTLLNVDHIEKVIKQTKLETGWYKSKLFVYHNNLMGMHYPRVRDTYSDRCTIADNGRKVASYVSWQSSVLDYILYIEYYKSLGYDMDNYYEFLVDAGYCEKGSAYIDILQRMT